MRSKKLVSQHCLGFHVDWYGLAFNFFNSKCIQCYRQRLCQLFWSITFPKKFGQDSAKTAQRNENYTMRFIISRLLSFRFCTLFGWTPSCPGQECSHVHRIPDRLLEMVKNLKSWIDEEIEMKMWRGLWDRDKTYSDTDRNMSSR